MRSAVMHALRVGCAVRDITHNNVSIGVDNRLLQLGIAPFRAAFEIALKIVRVHVFSACSVHVHV